MPVRQRKIVIMGYRAVGKSSLTIQFVESRFVDSYEPTVETTFTKGAIIGGEEYFFRLVDTAGQDEFSILPQSYTMDVHGYVLVYSVTSSRSFEIVKIIHARLLDMTGKIRVPIVLVGNKVDLHMDRAVSYEEGKQAAAEMRAEFVEASAKQNETVLDIFNSIVWEIEKVNGDIVEKSGCEIS